jgi:hypothetical protein
MDINSLMKQFGMKSKVASGGTSSKKAATNTTSNLLTK